MPRYAARTAAPPGKAGAPAAAPPQRRPSPPGRPPHWHVLQLRAAQTARAEPAPAAPSRDGLPAGLKGGIEQLSGIAMDDVRVHRNSPEPAKLGALAYAKGSEIHLGPGQERHLPHEAWHVVQQKQGRVRATAQLKGAVALNDDRRLETEADAMGAKAVAASAAPDQDRAVATRSADAGQVVQRSITGNVPQSWLGEHAQPDVVALHFIKPFLADKTVTSSNESVAEEIERALWAVAPNANEAHKVDQWRRELYKLKVTVTAFQGTRDDASEALKAIVDHVNWICAKSGAVNVGSWKLAATRAAPGTTVRVQWLGAAMGALLSLPSKTADPRPVPKKLQLSLDRHMWARLTANSESKAQNTMLLNSVSEATVQKDMEDLGTQYIALMQANKTSNVTLYREAERKYFVEKLDGEEPHVFPTSGSDTCSLSREEHEALKSLKAAAPAGADQWEAFVSGVDVTHRQSVLDKMTLLKFPIKDRNAFEAAMVKLAPPPKPAGR